MIVKEEVYVPQGTHRFLFCSDRGVFNMNYLRVWTPAPTLAPTMAPTPAPTPAPVVPGDDGLDTKWIYIGVGRLVGFLGLVVVLDGLCDCGVFFCVCVCVLWWLLCLCSFRM